MKKLLLLLAFALLPIRAGATASFVQLVGGPNTTGTTTASSNTLTVTTGNLLVIAISVGGGQFPNSCQDSGGVNVYHAFSNSKKHNAGLFGDAAVTLLYAYNITGFTGTITCSFTLNISIYSTLNTIEYSNPGGWVSDPADGTGNGGAANGTPTAGAMTLAQNNELVVSMDLNDTNMPAWVNLTDRISPIGNTRYGDYQGASSGSYTTAMGSAGGNYVISTAALKVPAAPLGGAGKQVGAFLVGP